MASGGIRADLSSAENIVWGENRNWVYTVVDSADANVTDFSGWEFHWFINKEFDDQVGLTALEASSLVDVENVAITAVAPTVTVPQATDNWPAEGPGSYAVELWRSDTGNEVRLAYGKVPIIA